MSLIIGAAYHSGTAKASDKALESALARIGR
jgi:hypothetical protein